MEIEHKNIKMEVSKITKKLVYSECLLRLVVLRFLCAVLCYLNGPFCHGALKLDLFTTFYF